jgi:murein DD-endopeptidase MepM/ murein hydrolase activator NlpD
LETPDMKRRSAWPYSDEDDPTAWADARAPRTPASAPKSPTPSTVSRDEQPSGERLTERAASDAGAEVPAAPAAPRAARVVAKIIDPAVRDDGRGDPQFSMEPARERVVTQRAPGDPHPVRERLLARARTALGANAPANNAPPANTASATEPAPAENTWFSKPASPFDAAPAPESQGPTNVHGFESLPELADDLDLIGAPERPRPERRPHAAPALPAPTALVLGTLTGLAAIALLFFGLTRLDPHAPLRAPELRVVDVPAPVPDDEPAPAPPVGRVQRPPRARVPGPWRIANAAPDARLKHLGASMGSQTFLAATQSAGIDLKEAYRVLTAFDGVKNLDRCRSKDTFSALVDAQSGRLTAFEYTAGEEEVYQAREGADGKLTAKKLDLTVKRHRAQGVVVLDGSFEESARRAGFEPGLGDYVNKALSGYVSTADLKAGDVLGLVVQEVTVLGEFSRYAGVEALEYRPVNGEPLRIYYQEHDKSRGYVDAKGRVFGKSRWTRPVPGAGVTSRYNPKRMHPILKRIKPHNGTDFGSPIGTPVVAASAGQVAFVGRAGPNGNMITIAHEGGFQTGYSHLSRFAKGLKAGARVEQRQTIGYVGSTGRSTGPHLHFSAKKNGRFIDPETLNLDGLLRLTVDQRLSSDLRRRYDRMLDGLNLPVPRAPRALTARGDAAPKPASDARPLEVEIAAARAAPPKPAPSLSSAGATAPNATLASTLDPFPQGPVSSEPPATPAVTSVSPAAPLSPLDEPAAVVPATPAPAVAADLIQD